MPSCAVTTMGMLFGPTARPIFAETVPEATAAPLTVIVAVGSVEVGVTVVDAMVLATLTV